MCKFNRLWTAGLAALFTLASTSFVLAAQETAANKNGNKEEVVEVTDFQTVEPGKDLFSVNYARIERTVSLPLARPMRKHALEFVIDHRTRQAFKTNSFRDFGGLDAGGLKVGLGLRYGLLDNLECGLYRLNGVSEVFDVYEFDLKYALMKQETCGLDLALRGGLTVFSQSQGVKSASGGFFQVLADRTFVGRLTLGTGILYHSDSSNEEKTNLDTNYSMAVPFQAELRLGPHVALDAEGAKTVAGYHSKYPVYLLALKMITNRHTFAIVTGNLRYMSADGVVADSPLGFSSSIIGFTITREFNL